MAACMQAMPIPRCSMRNWRPGCGGRFLVRMEDIDTTRCTAELAKAYLPICLAWPGYANNRCAQSYHWDDYAQALATLKNRTGIPGLFLHAARNRRSQQRLSIRTGVFSPDPGHLCQAGRRRRLKPRDVAANLIAGGFIWKKIAAARIRVELYQRFIPFSQSIEDVPAHPARWGDAVLARKETPTSYHLSVVVDDAIQQVTHVVRGADLEAATDLHALPQALLGLPTPSITTTHC